MKGPYTANKDGTISFNGNKIMKPIRNVMKTKFTEKTITNRVQDFEKEKMSKQSKVERAYNLLIRFDYTNVNRKFALKHPKLNPKKVQEEFIRFFSISAVMTHVAGSNAVDDYWHENILDTRRYFRMCNKVFGEYCHHRPNDGSQHEKKKDDVVFWDTIQTYSEYFGEPDLKIWGLKRRKTS